MSATSAKPNMIYRDRLSIWADKYLFIVLFLAGSVAINGLLDDQQAPFGGFKNSGVGREFGTYGIEAFLEPRAILEA